MYTYNEVIADKYKGSHKSTKRKAAAILAGIKRDPKPRKRHENK